jgi:hypothetical protein
MASWNRLMTRVVLAAGLVLLASQALATSAVPLDLHGTVYASVFYHQDEDWDHAYEHRDEMLYVVDPVPHIVHLEGASQIDLTSGDWGANLFVDCWGHFPSEAGTSSPASLTIGATSEVPADTPLILVLSPTVYEWSTGNHWDLTLTRGSTEILAQTGPTVALVDVFAGETLLLEFSASGPYDSFEGRVSLDMSVVPEPATLLVVALGGVALLLRRRTK